MLSATAARGSSWGRRVALALLASVMGLSVLAIAPAPAGAATGGCDADGDGRAGGTSGTVFSNGSDEAAAALEADTGVVLGPAAAAHRWRVAVCSEADGAEPPGAVRSVLGAPAQELAPAAGVWEASALAKALEELAPRYWRPGARTSPHVEGVQFVGLEMWLAVDPDIWEPFSATASAGEVSVSATATPTAMVWEFSDGLTRVCPGPGVQYSPGASGPAPCGRDFEHTTDEVPLSVSVSIDYAVAWTSTLGNAGTTTERGEANRYELMVSVATVRTWPSGPTLVWELSVEVDHTFAVFAGDHAVAVHNQDGCVDDPDTEGLAEDVLRLTPEESWSNPNTLTRHFEDHGADFGASSPEDYARQASGFLQRAQQQRLPTKIAPDGVIRVFDPATNTFGSYNPNGTTRRSSSPPARPTGTASPNLSGVRMSQTRYMCPVCGYPDLTELPRSSLSGGSYEICPSCRFQFGVTDDDRGISYEEWRERWIDIGMPWDGGKPPPPGWDPQAQLRALAEAGGT